MPYSGVVRVALSMGSKVFKAASKIQAFNLSFCLLKGPETTQAPEQKVVPKLIRGREVFSWERSLIPAQFNLTFTALITLGEFQIR